MRKKLRTIACAVLIAVILFSGWQVLSTLSEYKASEESYEALTQEYTAQRPQTPADKPQAPAEALDTTEETKPEETVPTETAPITVDFDALLADCPDVVGWLYCEGTPINYPIVQAGDNNYYLRRLLDGSYSISGSIFMDYRSASDFSSWNSIVYGHNMKNDAMFGTLQDYKEQAYYDAHPVLYLLTPVQGYKIELIGGYTTSDTAEDTYSIPNTQQERDALIAKARMQSTFQTEMEIADTDRLITLSTCAYDYDGARYVLVGVLRELASGIGDQQ